MLHEVLDDLRIELANDQREVQSFLPETKRSFLRELDVCLRQLRVLLLHVRAKLARLLERLLACVNRTAELAK